MPGTVPSDECLEADHRVGAEIDQRLERERQFVALERIPQGSLGVETLRVLLERERAEDLEAAAPVPFRPVHRAIGIVQHVFRALADAVGEGDPDAGRHRDARVCRGLAERVLHAFGDPDRGVGPGEVGQHDRELVTAECDRGVVPQPAGERLAEPIENSYR